MSETVVRPGDERCWTKIGVAGDGSCPELAAHVHCRNCPVFTAAGRALLDQVPPPGYLEGWTTLLAEPKPSEGRHASSVLVFRLGDEWLAVDTALVVEVAEMRPVHRIAHRSGEILAGLVNIRGQLHLCVALDRLLRVEPSATKNRVPPRLLVIKRDDAAWVFAADEVHGVHRFGAADLVKVPVTVTEGLASYAAGIFAAGGRQVGYLDGAALFGALRRRVG